MIAQITVLNKVSKTGKEAVRDFSIQAKNTMQNEDEIKCHSSHQGSKKPLLSQASNTTKTMLKAIKIPTILNNGACFGPDHGPCPCPGHILYLYHDRNPGRDLLHYLYFDSDAGPCHLVLCSCYSPYHPDPFLYLCFSLAHLSVKQESKELIKNILFTPNPCLESAPNNRKSL
jgi:hypothetical protein